uniref:hypothetical protein n=1 Tax=Candidatus Hodgkinia cicadicola TaxID=573658 RepID=UPI002415884B
KAVKQYLCISIVHNCNCLIQTEMPIYPTIGDNERTHSHHKLAVYDYSMHPLSVLVANIVISG